MNQRFLELPLGSSTAGSVTVTAPDDGNVCPPGHYLLFVLNSQGVPSEAKVISIGSSACGATVVLAAAATDSGCSGSAQATVSGTNVGTNYHWYIDGVYDSTHDNQTTVTIRLDNCRPQVTFAVEATPNCGGSPIYTFQSVSGGPFRGGPNNSLCECEVVE